jgi:hypothetical protein
VSDTQVYVGQIVRSYDRPVAASLVIPRDRGCQASGLLGAHFVVLRRCVVELRVILLLRPEALGFGHAT